MTIQNLYVAIERNRGALPDRNVPLAVDFAEDIEAAAKKLVLQKGEKLYAVFQRVNGMNYLIWYHATGLDPDSRFLPSLPWKKSPKKSYPMAR